MERFGLGFNQAKVSGTAIYPRFNKGMKMLDTQFIFKIEYILIMGKKETKSLKLD